MGIVIDDRSYIICNECDKKSKDTLDFTKLILELEKKGWYSSKNYVFWLCPNCKKILIPIT